MDDRPILLTLDMQHLNLCTQPRHHELRTSQTQNSALLQSPMNGGRTAPLYNSLNSTLS